MTSNVKEIYFKRKIQIYLNFYFHSFSICFVFSLNIQLNFESNDKKYVSDINFRKKCQNIYIYISLFLEKKFFLFDSQM